MKSFAILQLQYTFDRYYRITVQSVSCAESDDFSEEFNKV